MKFLQPNPEFQKNVVRYQPIDGLLAIGLFCILCALYALLAILEKSFPVLKEQALLVGGGLNLLMILIAFLLLKTRKAPLSSIGLFGGKWKQSCCIGLLLACVLFFNNCLSHILGGAKFVPSGQIVKFVLYYLTVALCEEIVFRGYIGTRLYGLMHNQLAVMLVNGVLFTVMHFPYRMIAYGKTLSELTVYNMGWILNLFLTHLVLSFIYTKTNSLYGAILPHWMSNLAYNLVAR